MIIGGDPEESLYFFSFSQKKWLLIAQKELEWVDQNTTKREYYLVYYAKTLDKQVTLNQQIINKLRLGQ